MLWIIGFLIIFFSQTLRNNPSYSRIDVWMRVIDQLPSLLNPFDVSHATVGGVDAGWHLLPQRQRFVATSVVLFLAAWSFGAAVCRPLLASARISHCERLVLQTGIGLSGQSLWTLLSGIVGRLDPVSILAPGVVSALFLIISMVVRKTRRSDPARTAESSLFATNRAPKSLWISCGILAFPFLLLLLVNGITPPFDFDVREYHLQGPKEWFQDGLIHFLQHNVYTSFPFLSEMLSLDAMVLMNNWNDGALAGKQLLACFPLLTTLCVFATGRRCFGTGTGLLAALIFLTVPWTLRTSLIAYSEGALTFFLISSVMSALLAVRESDDRGRRGLVLATGLLAGSAMAAKYTGLVSVVIPVGLLLAVSSRNGREFVKSALLFSVGVLITIGPWLARNFVDTGNPVYPLMYSLFGATDWSPELNNKWQLGHLAPEHSLATIPRHLLDIVVRNDWTSGLLFGLAVPTVVLLGTSKNVRWLWMMTVWMLVTWWAFTHRIDRFWIPIIPVTAVLAGAVWTLFRERGWRILLISVIGLSSLYHLQFWRHPHGLTGFQIGLMDLSAARQTPVRKDFLFLNSTLPDDASVLMIGEAEVFDARFCLHYNTVFDKCLFELWTAEDSDSRSGSADRRMKTADQVRRALAERDITHIFVNWLEILRYRRPGSYGYTEYVTPARFGALVGSGVLTDPVPLLAGLREDLSEQDRQLIRSWTGHELLQPNERSWTPILLYRVAD